MAKAIMLIRAPVGTRSGYGGMSRDIIRHLIDLDKWDVKVLPCPWGATPQNALIPGRPIDQKIIDRIIGNPQELGKQPEIFVSITVPNEFMAWGSKYNVGITAGIETTACSTEWLEGMNRMDLILTISEHSKRVLSSSHYTRKDQNGAESTLQLQKPIEVLHNCIHTDIFKRIPASEVDEGINDMMKDIKEDFVFLFVGHWLNGEIGADRKDVGMLVKVFLDTFRRVPKKKRPALILKSSGAGFSVLDREGLLGKLNVIKGMIGATNIPSVYLLHGELTDEEMNSLYNHPKVKANVTFTKGEGFGRPLLEFSMTGKPIIASGWSGHLDFLNPDESILLGGRLEPVHPSAVWEGVINKDTRWFNVSYPDAAKALYYTWNNYADVRSRGSKLVKKNIAEFGYDAIKQQTDEIFSKYVPELVLPEAVEFSLPDLPQLQKIAVPTEVEEHDMEISEDAEAVTMTAQVPQRVGPDG